MQDLLQGQSGAWQQTSRGGYTITMREEAGCAEALGALGADSASPDRLHVGWGSFRNLDIVAARGSSAVLLCDVNEHQRAIWERVLAALGTCSTSPAFTEHLARILPSTPRPRRFMESLAQWLASDRLRPESWLYEAETPRYDHVRGLVRAGRIGVLCLDIREAGRALEVVARCAARLGTAPTADTIYLSNLPWMLGQDRDIFDNPTAPSGSDLMWKGLSTWASDSTWVIRAEELCKASTPQDLRWRTDLERFPAARAASERARSRVSR